MKVKFVKTWGSYRKGTEFNGQFAGYRGRDSWNFRNNDNGEDLIGVPGCAFSLEGVPFDAGIMRTAITADNFLAYEWERIEQTDGNLRVLFNTYISGNSVAERNYLKSSAVSRC